MTKRQLCRMAAFVFLTAMMLLGLNWLLRDRETTLSALYSEEPDTMDVIIVGSSHVNSGYMPGLLWEEYGISACNAFSWSQPTWVSYHYIVESLKTQSPSVVVLDLNGMLYGNSAEQPEATDQTSYVNSFNIDMSLNFLQLIGTVDDCGIDLRDPIDFLPLVKYHTRWKNLDETAFTYNPHEDYDYLHGYGFQTVVSPNAQPQYAPTSERQRPYETAVEYLDKIVALSEKKGFSLVFVLAPYAYQENELAIFNWLDDYAGAHGIPFLNYCTDSERIGLDWATEFCDSRHVNYLGAQKLTRDLGDFLTENGYEFRAVSELPNAAQLDVDSLKLQRVIDIWENTQAGPETFFRWAARNGVLAVAAGGNASGVSDEVKAALAAAGFDEAVGLTSPGTSNAAVAAQGEVRQTSDSSGAECTESLSGVTAVSRAEITAGGTVSFGAYSASGDKLVMLYYDPILERPVYQIAPGEDGALVFTDLGADTAQ